MGILNVFQPSTIITKTSKVKIRKVKIVNYNLKVVQIRGTKVPAEVFVFNKDAALQTSCYKFTQKWTKKYFSKILVTFLGPHFQEYLFRKKVATERYSFEIVSPEV